MDKANFVFHGLFPDVRESFHDYRPVAKVVFDVEFLGRFHSHLMADIEFVRETEEGYFEVRAHLPFECADFPDAAVQYYLYILGPRSEEVTRSGPNRRTILARNLRRGEWTVDLEAREFETQYH